MHAIISISFETVAAIVIALLVLTIFLGLMIDYIEGAREIIGRSERERDGL